MLRNRFLLVLLILCALVPRARAQSHFSSCLDGTGNVFNGTVVIPLGSTPDVDGVPLAPGSEIAVFSSDAQYSDLCVGVVTWQGTHSFITVWGDDDTTPARDGLLAGEALQYRVWDSATATEYPAASVNVSYAQGNGIYANDAAYVMGDLSVSALMSVPVSVAEGWNLVGLPLAVADAHYLSLAPNAIPGTLFGFDGTYYQPDPLELEMGAGYWLRFSQPGTMMIQGADVASHPITLSKGWNLISGLSCSIPIAGIDDPDGLLMAGTLFGYDGSYYQALSLEAGRSYWVRAKSAGQITLDCSASKIQARVQTSSLDLDRFSTLHISDASGAGQTLYFDVRPGDESASKLRYSLPPIPPSGSFDARFDGGYRVTETDEAIIRLQARAYPLTIYAINLPARETHQYTLRVVRGNEEGPAYPLREGHRIEISDPQGGVLKLSRDAAVPTSFTVDQNYPNPFNPTTTIRYSLSEAAPVQVEVFNLLGQRMAVLVSEQQDVGYHEVAWDGSQVTSGLYFYMVQAGDTKIVKQMLLVK